MRRPIVISLAVLVVLGAATAGATETETVPPSTNPANRVVYPANGQDAELQMKDQLESYRWATAQTKWDPYEAHDVLVQKGYAAAQTAEQAQGGLVRGAARGALAGLAIGAIAGDAGKGAAIGAAAGGLTGGVRSRRQRQAAQSAADQAIAEFQRQFEVWDRNWSASMEGRGYTVK
jgi:hypothetical protein